MLKKVIRKIEVVCIAIVSDRGDPEPERIYLLPSGYKNSAIEVYESGYEELEVQLVPESRLIEAMTEASNNA